MSKLDKNTLKEIVKECLIEILSEGLTNGNTQKLSESFNIKQQKQDIVSTNINQKSNVAKLLPSKKEINKTFIENTNKIIKNVTNDPVLSEIFADTALTTLQEQNSADNKKQFIAKSNDPLQNFVNDNDPQDIFGNAATNWESLAFGNKK